MCRPFLLPEQKLPVKRANIDRVHINDVDVAETRERQMREYLAAQAACTDNEHFALFH